MNKKLGYYSCGGIEFASKIEACIYSTKTKLPVKWHFNDNEFRKFDWETEPLQTLDQLYDERAKQIRESYDYVILSFSGGADSNNILESFIRQNLHIDEILVNTMLEANKLVVNDPTITASWNTGAEHELQTVPRLQYIKNKCPATKITVMDLSKHVFDFLTTADDASWIDNKKESLNPGGIARYNYIHFKEVRNQFDKGKKIALVVGVDKPRVKIHNGVAFFILTDRPTNIITAQDHLKEYPNAVVENFYWAPEGVAIMAKQAHVVKRWLEANPQNLPAWSIEDQGEYVKAFRLIHEKVLRSVIYTTWDERWYQSDKATSDWHNEFDSWFSKGYADTKAFAIWQEGLDHVMTNAADYVIYKDGKPHGLQAFKQVYKIGTMKRKL